jgi:lauroyl/myristoyl acyltransferase
MYYLFRVATVVLPRLPHWFVLFLANIIGLVVWLVASKPRKQATANMLHVLGIQVLATHAGRKRLRHTVRSMFQYSVRNYLETFTLLHARPELIMSRIVVEGAENVEAALAKGKGLILFSAHLGPFDYLIQWIALKGYKTIIPVERLKDQRMLDLMMGLRSSQGIQYIPLGGSAPLRSIIQALRNNQIVLITADRAVEGESVVKPFFGEPARLPIGPVSLSQRTGAPLVGAFGRYGSSKLMIGEFVPLSLELTEEEQANTDTLMCHVIKTMERFIKAHPEQWVVFEPVWVDSRR